LSHSLDRGSVEAGQPAYLTLALRAPITPTHILMPYATLRDREFRWTTDSRLLTPEWLPNESSSNATKSRSRSIRRRRLRFELGLSDLTTGQDVLQPMALQSLRVTESTRAHAGVPSDALADFNAQIALLGATANGVPAGPELPTIPVQPGETIGVGLNWLAQQQVDESYTIFVHLIDASNRLIAQRDYTPMGGAFPTQLWIPKWIAGQSVNDPIRSKCRMISARRILHRSGPVWHDQPAPCAYHRARWQPRGRSDDLVQGEREAEVVATP
jgi:hypothetical protein